MRHRANQGPALLQHVCQGTKQSILPNFLPNHIFSIYTSIIGRAPIWTKDGRLASNGM